MIRYSVGGALAFSLILAGCAGGQHGVIPPASSAIARLVITVPLKSNASGSASARTPAFVSPATQSITVQVDSGGTATQNLTPSSPNCSVPGPLAPLTCTLNIIATPGTHAFTFTTYDQLNAAGNKLSTNSVTQSIAAGQLNTVNVTLAGVPASLQVLPLPGATLIAGSAATGFQFFSPASQSLIVNAIDADGNYILGPGAPKLTVSVTSSSPGSGISVGAANSANPNEFVVSATGLGTAGLTITAAPTSTSAGSALSATVGLTATTMVSTIAGNNAAAPGFADGTGTAALFNDPAGIAYDSGNGNLYDYDLNNFVIRQVSNAGVVTTIAGSGPGLLDGAGSNARFGTYSSLSFGIAYDSGNGDLYVADAGDCAIRQVTTAGVVTTIAGAYPTATCGSTVDGTGANARFTEPMGIAYDSSTGDLYVTDWCTVRRVTIAGAVVTIAGSPSTCDSIDGTGSNARFRPASGITYDSTNSNLYVTDFANPADIRQVTIAGVVTTIAGGSNGFVDGTGVNARFATLSGITYDSGTGDLYVLDTGNCAIRQLTVAGVVTTIAGSAPPTAACGFNDGLGSAARFSSVFGIGGIAADPAAGALFVTDSSANVIRQVKL